MRVQRLAPPLFFSAPHSGGGAFAPELTMKHLSAFCLALALLASILLPAACPAADAGKAAMSDKDLALCLEGKGGSAPLAKQGLMGMSPMSGPGLAGTMDGGFPPFFGNPQGAGQPQLPGYGQTQQPGYGQTQQPGYGQTQQPGYGQLDGCWSASNGQNFVIMIFMNGMCGLNLNGKQVYGPYTVQGQHLLVRFSNGQTFEADFAVQGNVLRFSTGLQLARQQMPQQPRQPQQPQQPRQQPNCQQAGGSPLQGVWAATLPNGAKIVFSFNGNQYFVATNGQQTEAGTFALNGSRLEFSVAFGQAAGQRGVNNWQINGSVLVITGANGQGIQLTRQS